MIKGSGRMVYIICFLVFCEVCIYVIYVFFFNKEYYICDSYFCVKFLCMLYVYIVDIG